MGNLSQTTITASRNEGALSCTATAAGTHVCHRAPSVPGIGALIRYLISSAFMHGWHFLDKPLSPDLSAVSSCDDDQLQNKTCI